MKILALVIDAFGGHGGIALYARNVLAALSHHPSEPRITAIPRLVLNDLEPLPRNLEYLDYVRGSKLKYVIASLGRLALDRAFDLVVCCHVNLLPVAEIARRMTGAPLLLFVYGFDAWTARNALLRPLLSRVDAIVSIRDLTLQRLFEWAPIQHIPHYVLENAIHLEHYGVAPPSERLREKYGLSGKRILMTLGRVDDYNFGFEEIVEVLPELRRRLPELVYMVVGGGRHLSRIEELARSRGVADMVIFTDVIAESEKAEHLRLADAFAMPGSDPDKFDRYPLRFSFLEAHACGLPVVASRPEEGGDAGAELGQIHVDPTDGRSLVEGLLEGLERGRGPVPTALHKYSFETFRDRLNGIVDEVMARRVGR